MIDGLKNTIVVDKDVCMINMYECVLATNQEILQEKPFLVL